MASWRIQVILQPEPTLSTSTYLYVYVDVRGSSCSMPQVSRRIILVSHSTWVISRAPIVAIWTDQFSWYFLERFSRSLGCASTPQVPVNECLSISHIVYLWHPLCFSTTVAAALPATHLSNHESRAAGLLLQLAASLLGLSDGVDL